MKVHITSLAVAVALFAAAQVQPVEAKHWFAREDEPVTTVAPSKESQVDMNQASEIIHASTAGPSDLPTPSSSSSPFYAAADVHQESLKPVSHSHTTFQTTTTTPAAKDSVGHGTYPFLTQPGVHTETPKEPLATMVNPPHTADEPHFKYGVFSRIHDKLDYAMDALKAVAPKSDDEDRALANQADEGIGAAVVGGDKDEERSDESKSRTLPKIKRIFVNSGAEDFDFETDRNGMTKAAEGEEVTDETKAKEDDEKGRVRKNRILERALGYIPGMHGHSEAQGSADDHQQEANADIEHLDHEHSGGVHVGHQLKDQLEDVIQDAKDETDKDHKKILEMKAHEAETAAQKKKRELEESANEAAIKAEKLKTDTVTKLKHEKADAKKKAGEIKETAAEKAEQVRLAGEKKKHEKEEAKAAKELKKRQDKEEADRKAEAARLLAEQKKAKEEAKRLAAEKESAIKAEAALKKQEEKRIAHEKKEAAKREDAEKKAAEKAAKAAAAANKKREDEQAVIEKEAEAKKAALLAKIEAEDKAHKARLEAENKKHADAIKDAQDKIRAEEKAAEAKKAAAETAALKDAKKQHKQEEKTAKAAAKKEAAEAEKKRHEMEKREAELTKATKAKLEAEKLAQEAQLKVERAEKAASKKSA